MAQYENEFSRFPTYKITKHNFEDVNNNNNDVTKLINEINSLRAKGSYADAAIKIRENRDTLSKYIVNAETFRIWEEEIYNTQKYSKQVQQSIHFDESKPEVDCVDGDVWIGN